MRLGKPGSQVAEVKVHPGTEINCIPLHKFICFFPHLCRDDQVLQPTGSKLTSYSGSDLSSGHLIMKTQNIVTKKFHLVRYNILETNAPCILMGYTSPYWIGLIKVLYHNKAPKVTRKVISINKQGSK